MGFADVLLAEVSPEEQALLQIFGSALLEQQGGAGRRDGSLGFGVVEVSMLAVAVPVAKAVVAFLLDIVKDSLADAGKTRLTDWLRSLRLRRSSGDTPVAPVALAPEVATQAGRVAYDHAIALGLAEDKALVLRSAVAGSLIAPAH